MEITPHMGLTLPTENEYYNVNVVNENNKKIDGAIGQMVTNEKLSTELEKKADLSYLQQNYDRKLVNSINLYVSTSGDDASGDGSEVKPFKNIQKALDVLPKNLGDNSVTVNLASGTYNIGFNANGFHNGVLAIVGNAENKSIINGDCIAHSNQLTALQLFRLQINGSKTDVVYRGVLTVSNVTNCTINSVEIDGVDKTEEGIKIIGQSNVGITGCTINNCNAAISTDTDSGTRGVATAHLYKTSGSNNSVGVFSYFAIISINSNDIVADTQYQKVGGIIINSDGTLL